MWDQILLFSSSCGRLPTTGYQSVKIYLMYNSKQKNDFGVHTNADCGLLATTCVCWLFLLLINWSPQVMPTVTFAGTPREKCCVGILNTHVHTTQFINPKTNMCNELSLQFLLEGRVWPQLRLNINNLLCSSNTNNHLCNNSTNSTKHHHHHRLDSTNNQHIPNRLPCKHKGITVPLLNQPTPQ